MFLIPFIKSLASKYWAKLISTIILLGEIMPSYFYCIKRRLLYIAIMALFSYQFSFYAKCTRANIWAFYNIYLVSNIKCIFFTRLTNL